MTGKRAFLELLKQEGVEIIFGNPGTTELPLMDALAADNEMRYVLALQEAVVMSMADGYAQASGKLAVANLHVTPGLGNAMGMLYDAQKANSPILVTAGQHDQSFTATEPILWGDLPPIARPLVKWSTEVTRLADLPRILHRAAKTALAPPQGPVFMSLPGDIFNSEGEVDLLGPTRIAPRLRGDLAAIEAAAELIANAKRPMIFAGDAVARSGAHAEIVALAEMLGAPVYAELLPSSASFPASHPLFRGTITRLAPAIRQVLDQYDLLLSIGGDLFTLSLPSNVDPMPKGLKVVHLDNDPWELGKNYPTDVAILGDPKGTLPDLNEAIAKRMGAGARGTARERLDAAKQAIAAERDALKTRARNDAGKTPMQALSLLHAIGETLPKDTAVVEEAISSAPGIRLLLASDDPQSYFGPRGGGIGWGLPAALGVKLALPDRPVVALVGDGSAMYTIQALWTSAHDRIPVVFVILNNTSYRILKQRLHAMHKSAAQTDRYVGMELTDPAIDFVGIARALGIAAERSRTVHETTDLLKQALASGSPMLIEAEIDRTFKP